MSPPKSLRSTTRFPGRKRQRPEVLTYSTTLASAAPAAAGPPKKRAAGARRPSSRPKAPASRAKAAKKKWPTAAEGVAMVGRCIRVDWPDEADKELFGEYKAMVFRYNARSHKHAIFYYKTKCAGESVEELCLYDESRVWRGDELPGADESRLPPGSPVVKGLGIQPHALLGRRIKVEWPGNPGMKYYDAIVADWEGGSVFQLVYQRDEYVELRDLLPDGKRTGWHLYPQPAAV